MKNTAYKLYAGFFNLFAHLPLQKKKAALLSPHMASFADSLGKMETEMQKRGFKTVRISGADIKPAKLTLPALLRMARFFTKGAFDLATAAVVFLNDNFMPMADLHFRREAVLTQLWHAEGAFKRFGLDIDGLDPEVACRVRKGNEKLTYVVCSSESVAPVYASAFGVPPEKVLPLGSPRADSYIRACKESNSEAFRKQYFGGTDKKVILYAPTFRDDPAENKKLLEHFDFDLFEKRFGDRYTLVLRLHPQFNRGITIPENVLNMTGFPDADALIDACDLLITDYSSICMDFALVGKPCLFYAFDLDRYSGTRNFYSDYKKYVPGPVAESFTALLSALEDPDTDRDKLHKFVEFNFGTPSGNAAEKIADAVIHAASAQ